MGKYEYIWFLLLTFFAISVSAQELEIDSEQKQNLLRKASELQQKQQQSAGVSQDYKAGFDDGYNQAVMDLVRSQLLKDPSIKPGPRYSRRPGQLQTFQALPPRGTQVRRPSETGLQSLTSKPKVTPIGTKPKSETSLVAPTPTPNPSAEPVSPAVQAESSTMTQGSKNQTQVKPSSISAQNRSQVGDTMGTVPSTVQKPPVVVPQGVSAVQTVETPVQPVKPVPSSEPDPALPWLKKTRGFLHKQNWASAIDSASRAIVANSKNSDGYIYRSWARAENGDFQEAVEDASKAVQLDGENPLAYNNRAYAYELANSPELAIMDYRFACKLGYQNACSTAKKLADITQRNKNKVLKLTQKANNAFRKKNWVAVERFTTQILKIDSNNTDAYINRAAARTESGKYSKALADCNNALIINPKLGVAYNNKGYVFELIGEKSKAVLEYETACSLGVKQSCKDVKRLKGG